MTPLAAKTKIVLHNAKGMSDEITVSNNCFDMNDRVSFFLVQVMLSNQFADSAQGYDDSPTVYILLYSLGRSISKIRTPKSDSPVLKYLSDNGGCSRTVFVFS
jgi:hypothetical protein